MSLVFQNIDPPNPLRLASVSPPPNKVHTRRAERGVGGQYLEDERHRIALLQ
jgi:hypothetical protein